MPAKLIKPNDVITVDQIVALAFGEGGSRKTSLCQTLENPVTFAFDKGCYRAFGRKDCVTFEAWPEVLEFDTSPYKEVVVDTIGMGLEKISVELIRDNPKNGNRAGGLSLPGYGALKNSFASFVSTMKERGHDLVFTAHEKLEKDNDVIRAYPDIIGGSYNILMDHCDMVGYLHFFNGKRVIDFTPSDRWMAKTPPCNWTQSMALPDFGREPRYFANLIAQAKESMGKISAQSAQLSGVTEEWRKWLKEEDPTIDGVNAKLSTEFARLAKEVKAPIWTMILDHMKGHGCQWNAEKKFFYKAPEEEGAAP